MKKNKSYSFISLILCFLLTFTSSCSNLSAILDKNTPNIQNLNNNTNNSQISENENIVKKLLNAEYKNFSIKSGEPAGTSISISKRYLLSTKEIKTYLPTDNDSGGQPPNRIKITTIVKTVDVPTGIDFTIDGVVTFNVPAGTGTFGAVTITDVDANFRKYEFIWDGKYPTGEVVKDGFYTFHALKTSGTKSLYLDTEIQVTSDPLVGSSAQYYKAEEFKDLENLINQIKAPEETANELVNVVKEIDVLNKKILSLQARVPVDNLKVTETQSYLTEAQNKKTVLLSSLSSSISEISSKKDSLRTFINTITKNSNFTQDYPLSEKPDGIVNYSDSGEYYDIDISSLIQSGTSLYTPDESEPDKTAIKNSWEVEKIRIETLDPSKVFSGADYFSNEIQTTKELINDYTNNVFSIEESSHVAQILLRLVKQINTHKGYLKTRVFKLNKDYDKYFQDTKSIAINLHNGLLLPFAVAMDNEGSFKNNTFVTSALKFDTKSIIDPVSLQNWINTYLGVFQSYQSADYSKREKIAFIVSGYTKQQLEEFREQDVKNGTTVVTDLVASADSLTGAFLAFIPTTPTEAMIYLGVAVLAPEIAIAGTAITTIAFFSKIALSRFASKLALSASLKFLLVGLKIESSRIISILPKKLSNNLPAKVGSVICNSSKNFHTNSLQDDCTAYFKKLLVDIIISNQKNGILRKWFNGEAKGQTIPKVFQTFKILESDFYKEGLEKLATTRFKYFTNPGTKLDPSDIRVKLIENLEKILADFESSAGVEIIKGKTKDIYVGNLKKYNILEGVVTDFGNNIADLTTNTVTRTIKGVSQNKIVKSMVGGDKDYKTMYEVIWSKSQQIRDAFPDLKNGTTVAGRGIDDLRKFFEELGITPHHIENTKDMIPIPFGIHNPFSHWGGTIVIERGVKQILEDWKIFINNEFIY